MRSWPLCTLAALLLSACPWPAGLPVAAPPGRAPDGTVYPDLRATAGPRERSRRDAAVIVMVEDYTGMSDRHGAHAMAAAWYRYFRESRGLRPWRIKLLRGSEATPTTILQALDDARWWVHQKNVLWFVFIGHVSGQPGRYGALWLPAGDGTAATFDQHTAGIPDVLRHLDRGHHPRSVAVFDGCMPPGLMSPGTETPGLPLKPIPPPAGLTTFYPEADFTPSLGELLAQSMADARAEQDRSRNMPTDLALFSAGSGDGCVARLPGTDFPALSYLLLGALRGWADSNNDGAVTAVEAITAVHTTIHTAAPGTPARPSLFTADVTLAHDVHEQPPALHTPTSANTPTLAPIPPPLIVRDDMVRFDAGPFRMGCPTRSDPDCESDERPASRVVLSRFFLDPHEVTVGDYQRCVAAGDCSPIDLKRCFVWTGSEFKRGAPLPEPLTRNDHPIMCVSWPQAERYCEAHGKQLPTEAEWERAAAGTTRRRFPWGDEPPTCARAHDDGCGEHTQPVGSHPSGATPEGVFDLAGNVGEWVFDWYKKSAYWDPRNRDPVGPVQGEVRVVRGGSYYESAINLRNAYRYGLTPDVGYSTVGFRCSR